MNSFFKNYFSAIIVSALGVFFQFCSIFSIPLGPFYFLEMMVDANVHAVANYLPPGPWFTQYPTFSDQTVYILNNWGHALIILMFVTIVFLANYFFVARIKISSKKFTLWLFFILISQLIITVFVPILMG